MPISAMDFQALTPEQSSPYVGVLKNALSAYTGIMNAAYLPQQLKVDLALKQADTASKQAYAQLMGPQFLAKMMGNEGIVANLPDAQKDQVLKSIANATGGANGINQSAQQNSNLAQYLKQQQSPTTNAISSYINSPQAQQQAQQEGIMSIPDSLTTGQPSQPQQQTQPSQQSDLAQRMVDAKQAPSMASKWGENLGNYKGIVAEGAEAGKIRANDRQTVGKELDNIQTQKDSLNELSQLVTSPIMQQIRQIPLAQQHEIAFYAKEGTPEQQEFIGKLKTSFGNVVKASARDFGGGQFRIGEQRLLTGMKPNESDTPGVMIGKMQALMYYNQMREKRLQLTGQIMDQYHMSRFDAEVAADKMVNGNQVRRGIQDQLYPKATEDDIKTMVEKYKGKATEAQIRQKLQAKGLL